MTSIRDIAKHLLPRSAYTGLRNMCYSRGIALAQMMPGLALARKVSYDYIRVSALELAAREIAEHGVAGAVAELGVFKGEFARIVNLVFSERTLYLFDTFEGFAPEDLEYDRKRNYSAPAPGLFADTSAESVLATMPSPERCVVKKGWFPLSADDCANERFCFVSLDADLYGPIYEGLRFFWPRLNAGGYIFVHDYNNDGFRGAKEAVRQFCLEMGVAYTPLLDHCGTAIIAKSIGSAAPDAVPATPRRS
jgi:O-methyltransferase